MNVSPLWIWCHGMRPLAICARHLTTLDERRGLRSFARRMTGGFPRRLLLPLSAAVSSRPAGARGRRGRRVPGVETPGYFQRVPAGRGGLAQRLGAGCLSSLTLPAPSGRGFMDRAARGFVLFTSPTPPWQGGEKKREGWKHTRR